MHHRIRAGPVTVGDPKEMAVLARLEKGDQDNRENSQMAGYFFGVLKRFDTRVRNGKFVSLGLKDQGRV
ncbi:MAG TPA: hypothetical protein VJP02_04710 [Candidatus Sulfotelmatobacter sp.]|nr:hypothetical protein [Candidatus Sulfotelmatobacter sp.]